jgi:hypothetical protein
MNLVLQSRGKPKTGWISSDGLFRRGPAGSDLSPRAGNQLATAWSDGVTKEYSARL